MITPRAGVAERRGCALTVSKRSELGSVAIEDGSWLGKCDNKRINAAPVRATPEELRRKWSTTRLMVS